jgi:hypothetical protein
MTYSLAGAALAVTVMGQTTGADMITSALTGEGSVQDMVRGAQQFTVFGLSSAEAGVVIAALVFAVKFLDVTKGMWVPINAWLARVLGVDHNPPAPPPPKPPG